MTGKSRCQDAGGSGRLWPEACLLGRDHQYSGLLPERHMKRFPIVTVITFAVAAGCATSPRATSGPSTNVSPRDTMMTDTTNRPDTSRTLPDTNTAALHWSDAS
jgi:hypothetical protein